jgi:large subunit ribosomal protein L15
MAISLSNVKKSSGSKRKGKRVGRGNSSGKGTYSARGLKGQKSRAGVSRAKLKRLGMKKNLLKIPKVRGFKSLQGKNQVVSVEKINKNFKLRFFCKSLKEKHENKINTSHIRLEFCIFCFLAAGEA